MTHQQFKRRGLVLIGAGLFTLALLVASGLGGTAPTARADGPATTVIAAPSSTPRPVRPAAGTLIAKCPEGTVLVVFDQPVYDASGLFVIGYKPVPYCVPEDLEPAG
jgi:hypothetical protein